METTRNYDYCGTPYQADTRNVKRGWGLCCSKSCAAKKREAEKLAGSERLNDAVPDSVLLKYERIENGQLQAEVMYLKQQLETTPQERISIKVNAEVRKLKDEISSLRKQLQKSQRDSEKLIVDKLKFERLYKQLHTEQFKEKIVELGGTIVE